MEKNNVGIGLKIKSRRQELGLTQIELAHRLGYKSKVSICKVENGDDNLTSDRIAKFARALECEPAVLMGWNYETVHPTDEDKIIESFVQLKQEARMRVLQRLMLYEADKMRGGANANSKKDA